MVDADDSRHSYSISRHERLVACVEAFNVVIIFVHLQSTSLNDDPADNHQSRTWLVDRRRATGGRCALWRYHHGALLDSRPLSIWLCSVACNRR